MNIKKLLIINIYGTQNNTKLVVTDLTGRIIYNDTGGLNCKNGRDKDSTRVASIMHSKLTQLLTVCKISNLLIKTRNKGSGYSTSITPGVKLIINGLQKHYNVINIHKTSPVTHGKLRLRKPKKR